MKMAIVIQPELPRAWQQIASINHWLKDLKPESLMLWSLVQGDPTESVPDLPIDYTHHIQCTAVPYHMADCYCPLIHSLYQQYQPDIILLACGQPSDQVATRLSYRTNGYSRLQINQLKEDSGVFYLEATAYSNNLKLTLKTSRYPLWLTAAPSADKACKTTSRPPNDIISYDSFQDDMSWLQHCNETSMTNEQSLSDADYVMVAGRGVGNQQNLEQLCNHSQQQGMQVAATRPVVMNGWMKTQNLVGISGHIIAPNICITAGVSGAGALKTGIDQSEVIIAINNDSDAPVFKFSDYGIVGDCNQIIKELERIYDQEAY